MSIDLHIHSTFSDGTFTPEELVKMASRKGVKAISITDHDTVEGVAQAIEAGKKYDVQILPGIEFSVVHKNLNIHALGYLFDHTDESFLKSIEIIQSSRKKRNKKIIERLQKCDIAIDYREVINISLSGQVGRPHIARLLVKKGVVRSIDEAFATYLGQGACAYVSRFLYSSEEAINIIHDAGGLAVLAHPVQIDQTLNILPDIINELVEMGLDGIELYYPSHTKKNKKVLRKLADKYQLVVTGGSDYHGVIRPGTDIARGKNMVPLELLDDLHQRWKMKQRS